MMAEKTFQHHLPSPEGTAKINQLASDFALLKAKIEEFATNSPERSVALTYLQTAAMWANKAVVHGDPGSVPA